jgi:hypothetical protein
MQTLKNLWGWFGKKLVVAIGAGLLVGLHRKFPDWPIPDDAWILSLAGTFMVAHSATDIASLFSKPGFLDGVGSFLVGILQRLAPGVQINKADIAKLLEATNGGSDPLPSAAPIAAMDPNAAATLAMAKALITQLTGNASPSDSQIVAIAKILGAFKPNS